MGSAIFPLIATLPCPLLFPLNLFYSLQLVPLFIFIGGGTVMSGAYLLRLAMGPHVSWNRNGNPEPWNKTEPTQQHKFYSVNMDYSKLKKEGPDF
uniref:Cytochrome c oxidase subunit NDUFA4 n=1 Tax=Oncorhynchus kisutch TaxID=8019 RepID=A0A8C7DS82_ONCKI